MKHQEIMFYNFWIEIDKNCQCDLGRIMKWSVYCYEWSLIMYASGTLSLRQWLYIHYTYIYFSGPPSYCENPYLIYVRGCTPSSIYSWSICHILEHIFFCLGHLGCAGSKEKKVDLSFSEQLLMVFFFNFLWAKNNFF